MSDEQITPNHDAWRDRLVELGLEELAGGVRPPDLRQQILTAAASRDVSVLKLRSTTAPLRRERWKRYLALAGCVLAIGAGVSLLLPVRKSLRMAGGKPGKEAQAEADVEQASAQIVARSDGATAVAPPIAAPLAAVTGPSSTREGVSGVWSGAASGEGQAGNGQGQGGASELIMMATPHVIVEGEDRSGEAALALLAAGERADADGAAEARTLGDLLAKAPEATAGVGINGSTSPFPNYTDVGMKFRQSSGDGTAPEAAEAPRDYAARGLHRLPAQQSPGIRSLVENGAEHYYDEGQAADPYAGSDPSLRGYRWHWREFESKQAPSESFRLGYHHDHGGDQYAPITENAFLPVSAANADNRLSTFSIDVDTASYANVRQFLLQGSRLPPPDAVRIEELVNYFDYDYAGPTGDEPFASNVEVAACPWAPRHRLVRIGIKGREAPQDQRPKSNLVFLVDVSGSMDEPSKLPLVVEGLRLLAKELGENDRIAIVVYASTEGLVLESTRGDQQKTILEALRRLQAGGSTAGGAGIQLAYSVAAQNFMTGGVNRVILCTDGDFNVGVTDVEQLQAMAAQKAKDTGVFLTVLGFGRGNLNDELMEAIADRGNGNYHYVDSRSEARKVLVEQMTGTLVTIAKDVKLQVEFNPAKVAAYRLIGYENRVLAAQDFNDDAKDAGEIGAGHTVTALYEVVPVGVPVQSGGVDPLKYAPPEPVEPAATAATASPSGDAEASTPMGDELLTLKIRYKQPQGDKSTKLEFPVTDAGRSFAEASADFQFASAVASFGMLLRGSPHAGDATLSGVLEIAESASGAEDPRGYRREFAEMVTRAQQLTRP
ncbi:MAG TPA: VWA domain-containing protein [Lacipirellulaceae bacterium]|nr:VWA domain-containing protein [Lacipirellulaceae bacterium]